MTALACVSPILPGKQEAWRRFCQVVLGSRRHEYDEFQQRLDITKQMVWLLQVPQGDMTIVYLESEHPELLLSRLAVSDLPFDCWFREQLLELHGLDMTRQLTRPPELVYVWQTPTEEADLQPQF